MSTTFQPNPRVQDEIANDPQFGSELMKRASEVRKGIRANLPKGRAHGMRVAPFGSQAFARVEGSGRDIKAVVGTKWSYGHLIEFGSAHNPAYSPVRKTVRQLGYTFREGGK